jgi:hypothetical protein
MLLFIVTKPNARVIEKRQIWMQIIRIRKKALIDGGVSENWTETEANWNFIERI